MDKANHKRHDDHSSMKHDKGTSTEVAEKDIHAHTEMKVENSTHDMHAAHAGRDMSQAGAHAGHVDHSGHEDMFRRRFWISLLLSIPVLLYTPMLQMWFGFQMP